MTDSNPFFNIRSYHDYLSPKLARELIRHSRPVAGVAGLTEIGQGGGLESQESLQFLTELYVELEPSLRAVLSQRVLDRKFIDERARACYEFNKSLGRKISDPDYKTVLGLCDGQGRVVFGALSENYCKASGEKIAPLPDYLKGPHVTLFGPPDSAKMAINAMNAYHRKLPGEPSVVPKLLESLKASPMWGADDEDSKTPIRSDLVDAGVNLTKCFEGTLSIQEGDKKYSLENECLSLPIKRFPGLALPSSFLFYKENPIPLHLYDFALHLYQNRKNPKALVFYVPKLENEEEARYIHQMVEKAERRIKKIEPSYVLGTVRLMIVLENPRAILRAHEIMDALHPYFVGASLGWHDYLASTARLFREDGNYRIPVKADPNIVVKYIKASHLLLADAVGSRDGIKVGGMYGILPVSGDPESLHVTLRGFFKDVITQMKRNLTGFWVAHPDFMRLGLAIVSGWKEHQAGRGAALKELVKAYLSGQYQKEILDLIEGEDTIGMDRDDPGYVRSLIVADIEESDFIPNNHPDEIRYNVFQSLQYLTDWLTGNGCVALPTQIDGIPVRVMDDLATAERSRWEVWAELRHGRFKIEDFIRIAHEEMNFIRRDLSDSKKIVQVKWSDRTSKWYPVAFRIMLKLMTDPNPPEFATELLIPFTWEKVRDSESPLKELQAIDSSKYSLLDYVEKYDHYFEICGVERFAENMASLTLEDEKLAEEIVLGFTKEEVLSAAHFHGDIGQSKKTLDSRASQEQAKVFNESQEVHEKLKQLGEEYRRRFGFKFLISAQGKTGSEMLGILESRLKGTVDSELNEARRALWEITKKRMLSSSRHAQSVMGSIQALIERSKIAGLGIAIQNGENIQNLTFGVERNTRFEIASLSKVLASSFSIEYFQSRGISLSTSVNRLLKESGSSFQIPGEFGDQVQIQHLMNHTALNMHYVKGIESNQPFPNVREFLDSKHGYEPIRVLSIPGERFHYSGGGFLVLEHLIEAHSGRKSSELLAEYFKGLGLSSISFDSRTTGVATGYFDDGRGVPSGHLNFPAFSAGGFSNAEDVARFLQLLTHAFHHVEGVPGISHDTAVQMLKGRDLGSQEFMGAAMGLGVFIAEAGSNRIALHQGANEGFRALFLHCFSGPDAGKGFVLFANSDNKAVLVIAEIARMLLRELSVQGIDWKKLSSSFDFKGIPQEQIVNLGYKRLLIDAFIPDLPEEIVNKGEPDPLAQYNKVVGAEIVTVTNQRFARAENLISPFLPIFDPELFGLQGKTMDSWESVRHNPLPQDECVLKLKSSTRIRYVSFSTMFHDGNHPEHVSLHGKNGAGEWFEIVPKTKMDGHSLWRVELESHTSPVTHLRVMQYPDGGLSRLQVFEDLPEDVKKHFTKTPNVTRFSQPIPKTKKPLSIPYSPDSSEIERNFKKAKRIDYASLAFGGKVLVASNEHYGPAAQVISPFPPINMFDGMESARSRKPGHSEEVIIRLGKKTKIERVQLDFSYFVNNNPLEVSIEASDGNTWREIVPKTNVKKFAGNRREFKVQDPTVYQELRVRTYPDGGINRIRVFSE